MTIYTQIPGSLDLSGVIGDDWSMGLDWDIALTGYTWSAAVVDSKDTEVAVITVTVDDATNGLMTLTITDTLTDIISEKTYRWYLKQTNADSERIWLAGFFKWYKKKAARFGTSNGTTISVSVSSARGTQGSTGAQGAQGAAGAQGSTGPQGSQGAQGAQGTQGPQGSTGAQGPQGAVGSSGLLWDTVSYTVGDLEGDGGIESPSSRTITITLKLGDTEVATDTTFYIIPIESDNSIMRLSSGVAIESSAGGFVNEYSSGLSKYFLYYYYYTTGVGGYEIVVSAQPGDETDLYLAVLKPTGGIEKILVDLTP